LTNLLQDSIGGNSKTLFIINVKNDIANSDETTASLKFAEGTREIKLHTEIFENPELFDKAIHFICKNCNHESHPEEVINEISLSQSSIGIIDE